MNKWKSMKTCGHSNCGTKSVYLWTLAGFRLHWSVCAKLCGNKSKSSWETREKTRQNAMPNFFLCQNRNAEIYLCFQFIALSFGIVLSSWNVQHFGTCHCVRAIWSNVNITIETRTFIHTTHLMAKLLQFSIGVFLLLSIAWNEVLTMLSPPSHFYHEFDINRIY